jgi:hypothetical protein
MSDKIWRIYGNGSVKDESHVLHPHRCPDGFKCTGYGGDVAAWSKHNQKVRGGCAQIHQSGDDTPVVLYAGSVSQEIIAKFIAGKEPTP